MGESEPVAQAAAIAGQQPILIVDDDPGILESIQWALEDEGWPVETAANGAEAIDRATVRRPALIILDWSLPPVTGEMVSQAVRAAHLEPIPILLVTADGRAPEKARRARAFDFLMKPFEIEDLIQAVYRGLRSTT